jgi:hypothetical protein
MRLATAFQVFGEIVAAGLEGRFARDLSVMARWTSSSPSIVERHDVELDVGEHRQASLK